MDSDRTLSIKQTAELLKVNRKHVYKLIERGQLRRNRREVYREGGPFEIPLADVLALLPAADRAAALERLK